MAPKGHNVVNFVLSCSTISIFIKILQLFFSNVKFDIGVNLCNIILSNGSIIVSKKIVEQSR